MAMVSAVTSTPMRPHIEPMATYERPGQDSSCYTLPNPASPCGRASLRGGSDAILARLSVKANHARSAGFIALESVLSLHLAAVACRTRPTGYDEDGLLY